MTDEAKHRLFKKMKLLNNGKCTKRSSQLMGSVNIFEQDLGDLVDELGYRLMFRNPVNDWKNLKEYRNARILLIHLKRVLSSFKKTSYRLRLFIVFLLLLLNLLSACFEIQLVVTLKILSFYLLRKHLRTISFFYFSNWILNMYSFSRWRFPASIWKIILLAKAELYDSFLSKNGKNRPIYNIN